MTDDLRLELRCKNNVLWHAIYDLYRGPRGFAKAAGVSYQRVLAYLTLTRSPYEKKTGEPTVSARRICDLVGLAPGELFNPVLYADLIPRRLAFELPVERMRGLDAAKTVALPPGQIEDVAAMELRRDLEAVLHTLRPREEKVIRMRFGLDDGREYTLAEVARFFDLTTESIRRTEARAFRKLRYPMRTRQLEGHRDKPGEETAKVG